MGRKLQGATECASQASVAPLSTRNSESISHDTATATGKLVNASQLAVSSQMSLGDKNDEHDTEFENEELNCMVPEEISDVVGSV